MMDFENALVFGIDLQNDFVMPNGSIPGQRTGRLLVNGAVEAIRNAKDFTIRHAKRIKKMKLSMDKHNPRHIGSPLAWVDKDGNHPTWKYPTEITIEQLLSGEWRNVHFLNVPIGDEENPMVVYSKNLARLGRYKLMVWGRHCEDGTFGACLAPDALEIVEYFANNTNTKIQYINKGMNLFREHYSAFETEVPHNFDDSTFFDSIILGEVLRSPITFWYGFATDFCLTSSAVSILSRLTPEEAKNHILLRDCCAGIFPEECEKAFKKFESFGGRVMNSTDF